VSAKFGVDIKYAILCSAKLAGIRSFDRYTYVMRRSINHAVIQVGVKLPKDRASPLKDHAVIHDDFI